MNSSTENSGNGATLTGTSKRLFRRLMAIGENRLELFAVEAREERERFLLSAFLFFGAAAFALLSGFALSVGIVVAFWNRSPLIALGALTVIYAGAAWFLLARLARLRRDWETFPETIGQLKKDRQCLEQHLK